MNRFRSFALRVALLTLPIVVARAITVSGHITEADGVPVAGVTVTIEQVGGELPPLKAVTGADGGFQVGDPLLFGNVRITPSLPPFGFAPAQREVFTDASLGGQDFTATALTGGDMLVATEAGVVLRSPATLPVPTMAVHASGLVRFALRNTGGTVLTDITATFSGPQAGEFSIVGGVPSGLAPGATNVLTVGVAPAAAGAREATLAIGSSDPNESPFTVKLTTTALSLDVTTTADAGPGSLREAFANAALVPGADVLGVDPALAGQTITLLSPIVLNDPVGVSLDALPFEGGLVLSAGRTNRHFIVAGGNASLLGLRLVDGAAPRGGDFPAQGGSILNLGTLELIGCAFVGNAAISGDGQGAGGAVFNNGSMSMDNCVLSTNVTDGSGGALAAYGVNLSLLVCRFEGNQALDGGAVDGDAAYGSCTFVRNVATRDGGAVHGFGEYSGCVFSANEAGGDGGAMAGGGLFQRSAIVSNRAQHDGGGVAGSGLFENCTFSGNQAGATGGALAGEGQFDSCTVAANRAGAGAGGIHFRGSAVSLKNSIVAGNQGQPADVKQEVANLPLLGVNLIGDLVGSGLSAGPAVLTGDPRLAPLDDYGGNTFTMALLPGSPAMNAGRDSDLTTDQRGYPIWADRDVGAYESGTITFNYNAFIWELLDVDDPAAHAPGFDFDGDGVPNHDEFVAWTDPTDPAGFFQFTAERHEEHLHMEFWGEPGRLYTLVAAASPAGPWIDAGLPPVVGQADLITFTVERTENQQFFRVAVEYED